MTCIVKYMAKKVIELDIERNDIGLSGEQKLFSQELSDIFFGNKNLPPYKMFGWSKVVPNKTKFWLFQLDKCPMSGDI